MLYRIIRLCISCPNLPSRDTLPLQSIFLLAVASGSTGPGPVRLGEGVFFPTPNPPALQLAASTKADSGLSSHGPNRIVIVGGAA